jgi:predicted ATPase/Tfp pilus assembly protein PilF
MTRRLHHLRLLAAELRRRRVVRTAIAYGVFAGGFIQLSSAALPALPLPPFTLTIVVVLAIGGLPLAVLLAWLYDIDIKPDAGAQDDDAPSVLPVTRLTPTSPDDDAGDSGTDVARRRHAYAVHGAGALGAAATPFVGREQELGALLALLDQPDCRLITIIGAGGVGKTRLALRAAALRADQWRDGVVRVGLSGLASAELLPAALLEAFGITPSRRSEPADELASYLDGKDLLLVLDNFEHLSNGAAFLGELLQRAPGMRLLVTSRERLNLHAETLLALDGLSLVPPASGASGASDATDASNALVAGDAGVATVPDSDAVRLFEACAFRLDQRFRLGAGNRGEVERICRMLGGVPLAIELAAAWTRVMSATEILAELEQDFGILAQESPDLPERHRCMSATFDASWRLLTAEERRAAAALSVFRTGFDRHGAAAVASAELPLLRSLMDKSLLSRAADRFVMLDVVRQYARARLSAHGATERTVLGRHVDYHARLLEDAASGVILSEPTSLVRVALVIDDVRAAWGHATQCADVESLQRMLTPLHHFYDARGWAQEGVAAFEKALAATAAVPVGSDAAARRLAAFRGRLETRCGVLHNRLGEIDRAELLLSRGMLAAEDAGDREELVFALQKLGANLLAAGQPAAAEQAQRKAIDLARRIGATRLLGWSLNLLGNVMIARGEYAEAERLYGEALAALRQADDRSGVWMTSNNLGVIAAGRKHWDDAWRHFSNALEQQAGQDNRRSAAMLYNNLGSTAREMGNLDVAASHLERALRLSRQMGYGGIAALAQTGLAVLDMRRGSFEEADTRLQDALRTALAAANLPVALQALGTGARLRQRQGDVATAGSLAATVATHPASDDDARRDATALLDELGIDVAAAPSAAATDLDDVIAAFAATHDDVEQHSAGTSAAR